MPDGKELCVSESVIKNIFNAEGAEGVKMGQA